MACCYHSSKLLRFQGCLVGAVIGDCIGAVYDMGSLCRVSLPKIEDTVGAMEAEYKLNVESVGTSGKESGKKDHKKSRKQLSYTDDTAMTRSVAKSLYKNKVLDVKDLAKRFTEAFLKDSGRGYGCCVIAVFQKLSKNKYKDVFGPATEQFDGKGSYGNGGAMRIAPAALFAVQEELSFDEIVELVGTMTRITHTNILAIHGAILQCYAVHLALNTVKLDVNSYLDQLISKMKMLEEQTYKCKEAKQEESSNGAGEAVQLPYSDKLEKMRELVDREQQPEVREIRETLGVFIAALDSVPAAIYCFLRATKPIDGLQERNEFERTIMYAIHHGGDTDTVATMAGAIAGAYYGLDIIPLAWRYGCEGVDTALKDGETLCNYKMWSF